MYRIVTVQFSRETTVPPRAPNVGPSLPHGTRHGYRARRPQGRPFPAFAPIAPFRHCGCLGNLVPSLPQGHPTACLFVSVPYRPFGAQTDAPTGRCYFYSRPPPASGLSGLSRWSWPWSRRCRRRLRFASLRSGSARFARSTSTPVAGARRRRNPAAGRWTLPAASHPRLRFGHPARPPKGQLRCSFSYTSIVSDALFVVSLCLATVGFAVTARWRYGCALNSCQDCASGYGWKSCHDGAIEYQMEMLTRFATSHALFLKASIHLSVCYP